MFKGGITLSVLSASLKHEYEVMRTYDHNSAISAYSKAGDVYRVTCLL